MFLDTIEEHGLHQHVHEPTCDKSILIFSTNPDLVEKVTVSPGMSDHCIVTANINVTAKLCKKPRKLFIFKKMDKEAIKKDAISFQDKFFQISIITETVNESWVQLKSKIFELLSAHVPQKTIRQWWDVPWMTQPIRRLIRKKKRVYFITHKQFSNNKTWEKFKKTKKGDPNRAQTFEEQLP